MLIILASTPIWVWALFIFLLTRGIAAFQDREMALNRLFILPVTFFIWTVYSVGHKTVFVWLSFMMMLAGAVTGIVLGWLIWRKKPRLIRKPHSSLIICPGTSLSLLLMVASFMLKFSLAVWTAVHPELFLLLSFNLLFGFVNGVIGGIFWGGALTLFIPLYPGTAKNVSFDKNGS